MDIAYLFAAVLMLGAMQGMVMGCDKLGVRK
jgi:hypothetical protein